jgi:hypothetical protein
MWCVTWSATLREYRLKVIGTVLKRIFEHTREEVMGE